MVSPSSMSAEFGRTGGGILNVTTKSGTNTVHGTLFEFLRNSVLGANDYFNNLAGQPRVAFKMNQFGGSVGGPLVPGGPANLCVIDPRQAWTVEPARLASLARNTPYAGRQLTGRVRHTVVAGEAVVIDQEAQR